MTVVETLLVFAGAPLAIIAVLALLTMRPDKSRRRSRYKPGQPWEHPPVWYEPHPERPSADGHGPAPSGGPAAVPGSGTAALGSSMYPEQAGERALDDDRGAGVGGGEHDGTTGGGMAMAGASRSGGARSGGSTAAGATAAGATTTGGATGGATAAGASGVGPRAYPGGPLGGARGTW